MANLSSSTRWPLNTRNGTCPHLAYHLNLGDEDDREVVSLLCQVKNVELQNKYSTGAKASEIELIWRNAKVKGAHHKFRADRCLPHNGFLEVDLVSSQLPETGATAMDSELCNGVS